MLNVGKVLLDPRFNQAFGVIRMQGAFAGAGVYGQAPSETLQCTGSIQPATAGEVAAFQPEGERGKALIRAYTKTRLYVTTGDGQQSDIVTWHGAAYRVVECFQWGVHGYWKAILEACVAPAGVAP